MAAVEAPDSDNEAQRSLRDVPSISLVDHTKTVEQPAELSGAPSSLAKTLTQGSIRQTLARRKYQRSKWQEGRGSQSGIPPPPDVAEEGAAENNGEPSTPTRPKDASFESNDGAGLDQDTWGKGRVRRGGQKVKDVVRSSKQTSKTQVHDPDSHVDILYENQRGFFFAGIPRFSSNSLLNFDPTAWLDGRFHPSAVDITNAQVPDPSWEWTWRCWYVDMSGDVDEEGWEYSFWFGTGAAWHGTHPWFHSFVRRRRWLRKRSRRKGFKAKDEAHALTSDYFTIHSKVLPAGEDAESLTTSEKKPQHPVPVSSAWGANSWEYTADLAEVTSIPDLLRGLKTSAVDREKIVLVRRFLNQAGEELHYLAENMEHIMKLLVFQNSRRQLLSILMHEFEAVEQHRNEHESRGEVESDEEKRHIDNLLKAVEAADEQCKQLEYWSDVKDMARDGDILCASDHTHGWDHSWQGLDASGPSPRTGSPSDANSEDEHISEKTRDKGKQPARGTDETDVPGGWTDGATAIRKTSEPNTRRPSEESGKNDEFHSPEEEKTQAQAMQSATTPSPEPPTPITRNEPKEDDEDDDQATERAPSEDEGEVEDTPPAGATPVTAIANLLNGHMKEDKGTASQHSDGESKKV